MRPISSDPLSANIYDYLTAHPNKPFTAAELQKLRFPKHSERSVEEDLKRLHQGCKIRRSPSPPYSYSWDKTCFLAPL